jgi:hypothetical protein
MSSLLPLSGPLREVAPRASWFAARSPQSLCSTYYLLPNFILSFLIGITAFMWRRMVHVAAH